MDANDAASYVQELAGDGANIIFGAMYDDTYADEASITVIATGLEDPNSDQPQPIFASRKVGSDFRFPKTDSRPSGGFSFSNRAGQSSAEQAVSQPAGGTVQVRMPQSKVTERDIQIPDFLKRS
jgi:cell division protein FtsZ